MKRALFLLPILALAGCSSTKTAQVPNPAFTPWPNIEPEQARKLTDSRMKQLVLGVLSYKQKHDETFPDMSDADALRNAVYPFLMSGGADVFVHPVSGEAFSGNPSLSKQKDTLPNPSKVALIYETTADANLTRAVMFADGRFERIDESDWAALKATSNIP